MLGIERSLSGEWIDDATKGSHFTEAPALILDNSSHATEMLARLNTLRTEGQLCDVTMQVGRQSFPAHRCVLASTSGHLMQVFTEEESAARTHFKLPPSVNVDAFQALVNYAYTSKLEVLEDQIAAVYTTATLLKVPAVALACSQYLAQNLTRQNCLAIRGLANSTAHGELTEATDAFIASNIQHLVDSEAFAVLPSCMFDIVGVTADDLLESGEDNVARLVVTWLEAAVQEQKLQSFTENPHVLYLTGDNELRDCLNLEDSETRKGNSLAEQDMHEKIHSCDLVQDYVKASRRKQIPAVKGSKAAQRNAQAATNQNRRQGSLEKLNTCHEEWKLIASCMVKESSCVCVAMLGDQLTVILLKFRPYPTQESSEEKSECVQAANTATSVGDGGTGRVSPVLEKAVSLAPIAVMSQGRCSAGVASIQGKLLVVGGYDRGECLASMECYNPATNTWTTLPAMRSARGRFDVAQVANRVYACGGSDGSRDLKSAEVFDWETQAWSRLPNMMYQRSSPGVAALNGKVYVVGGWSGCAGLKKCEVYDPAENKWTPIADMSTGRSQAGVCTVGGRIYVFGGCDAWNCTNTAEVYEPETDEWRPLPNMISHRRGTGVAVFNDLIYVVGGSDGQASLACVEIFDPQTESWTHGPMLIKPRANVSAAVLGRCLYAVGGFGKKRFLDTLECLVKNRKEWSDRAPRYNSSNSETSSAESASDMESTNEGEAKDKATHMRKKRPSARGDDQTKLDRAQNMHLSNGFNGTHHGDVETIQNGLDHLDVVDNTSSCHNMAQPGVYGDSLKSVERLKWEINENVSQFSDHDTPNQCVPASQIDGSCSLLGNGEVMPQNVTEDYCSDI